MKRNLVVVLLLLSCTFLHANTMKIALVLSGGGARGIAHVAIIEALEAQGIPIDMVIGTSMGSLVGGLYSAGYTPKEIRNLLTTTDLVGLFSSPPLDRQRLQDAPFSYRHDRIFTLGFGKVGIGDVPALISDQRILELFGFLFAKYPQSIDFDTLPIPFRCVSTDVVSAERIVHEQGSLVSAIRSSISIPLVFTPFPQEDGRLAVDGGVVDNLPIELARSLGYDIVIACDVNEMQIQNPEQLKSLSAIAMQTIILVTQQAAAQQHESADLLFFPKLQDIFALDFTKYNTILQRGYDSVEEKRDELKVLANTIAEHRPLVIQDPDRVGPYFLVADPKILQIQIRDISGGYDVRVPPVKQLYSFLGRRLDGQTATELHLKLRELKQDYGLASLSYEMGNNGTLLVYARGFGEEESFISMGFQADMGFSNALPASFSWYRADAYLDAEKKLLFDTDLTLSLEATLGHKSGMSFGLHYPLAVSKKGVLKAGFAVSYHVGSLSVRNTVTNADRSAPLDREFFSDMVLQFTFHEYGKSELRARYQLDFLNDTRYARQFVAQPQIQLSTLYNSLRGRLSTSGSRYEALFALGFDQEVIYTIRLGFRRVHAVNYSDSIGYDIQVSLMGGSPELLGSYADVGSLEGIPGYSIHTLRRELAILGFTYQRRIVEMLGYPSYGKLILRGGCFDAYDPYHDLSVPASDPFKALVWDLGLGFALGLETPVGEVIAHIGTSLAGMVTFSLGVY